MERMKIRVTREHIRRGRRCDSTECPLALAMREAGLYEPAVSKDVCYWGSSYNDPQPYGTARLPDQAQAFINRFDEDLTGEPFEFELNPI